MQQASPAVYPLFQGNQWTTRLEIAFAAMFAALVAGLLILLIALTLIVLKLGFLLLLVAGPFFLIIGTHPGFGRVIAIRWFEMLVGVLMKQAAVAIVLSVLLYCYSLIMGTADAVLPWALKILMIALVTVAVFIYRKPFSHLFSAVGYGTIGSTERAEYSLREASHTFRRSTLDAATAAVPGVASYRAARFARRSQGQPAAAAGVATGAAAAAAAEASAAQPGGGDAYVSRLRPDAPPPVDTDGEAGAGSRRLAGTAGGAGSARARNAAEADSASGRVAPPLDLPPRAGTARRGASPGPAAPAARAPGGPVPASPAPASPAPASPAPASPASAGSGRPVSAAGAPASGWSRGAGRSAGTGARPRAASPGPLSGPAAPVRGRAGGSAPPISGGASGQGGSSGSGSGSGPAWPASGWPAAGARQRSGGRGRPSQAPSQAAPSTPPADQGGTGASGKDEPPATPFWLRPIRRDK